MLSQKVRVGHHASMLHKRVRLVERVCVRGMRWVTLRALAIWRCTICARRSCQGVHHRVHSRSRHVVAHQMIHHVRRIWERHFCRRNAWMTPVHIGLCSRHGSRSSVFHRWRLHAIADPRHSWHASMHELLRMLSLHVHGRLARVLLLLLLLARVLLMCALLHLRGLLLALLLKEQGLGMLVTCSLVHLVHTCLLLHLASPGGRPLCSLFSTRHLGRPGRSNSINDRIKQTTDLFCLKIE
mmetsp:Transcript_11412/g.22382  ORF Transcript_11412/g.22382 Transcript_11412/m.22382 type:complete len:240 (+) Transcript_11412:1515-2234(+)